MDIEKLVTLIQSQGGVTLDPETMEPADLRNGFMVSAGHGLTYHVDSKDVDTIEDIIDALWEFIESLDDQKLYVGAWIEPGETKITLELSEHIYGLESAIVTAKRRAQKAIYDLQNNRDIPMSGKHYQ